MACIRHTSPPFRLMCFFYIVIYNRKRYRGVCVCFPGLLLVSRGSLNTSNIFNKCLVRLILQHYAYSGVDAYCQCLCAQANFCKLPTVNAFTWILIELSQRVFIQIHRFKVQNASNFHQLFKFDHDRMPR